MYAASSLLAFAVLLASFESGLCINCYQCASASSQDCKDPFKAGKGVMNINCDSADVGTFYRTSLGYLNIPSPQTFNAPRYCVKMILETNSGDSIIRTCVEGPANNMNKTCVELERVSSGTINQISSAVGFKNQLKHCSVCDKDGCNGAAGTAASISLAAAAFAVAYFGYH